MGAAATPAADVVTTVRAERGAAPVIQARTDALNPLQMLGFAADVQGQLERQQDVGLGEDSRLVFCRGLGEAQRRFHVAPPACTPCLRGVLIVDRQDVQIGGDRSYLIDESGWRRHRESRVPPCGSRDLLRRRLPPRTVLVGLGLPVRGRLAMVRY